MVKMKFQAVLFFLLLLTLSKIGLGQVQVDDYGAFGNGITDDSAAIQDAIDAAGVGGLVEFTPGRIYIVCRALRPKESQTIDLKWAVIKRCNEIVTQLNEWQFLFDYPASKSSFDNVVNPTFIWNGFSIV